MTQKYEISNLDFDTIKTNLKNYLRNQSEFSDYDFEGSAMNVILDILAYNTHYNAVHTNFAFGETFLDSATKRTSVVSRAKELGYLPTSSLSAKALLTLSFSVSGNPLEYVLPKDTIFSTNIDNKTFYFRTTKDSLFNNVNNIFTKTIEVVEGKKNTYNYTVDLSDLNQRFIIPSKTVDLTTLVVKVKSSQSTSSAYSEYTEASKMNLGDINSISTVYFLQEAYDSYYEVYFGDGVFGKALENGNVIQLEYHISSESEANNLKTFSLVSSLSSVTNFNIVTQAESYGGSEKESIDSIKFMAPMLYQSQKRAVTEDDYVAIIKKNYPSVDDVAVWGGERNDTPYYGKVYVALKPKANYYFSNTIKEQIKNEFISRFNVVGIRPEIVDPDYTYVSVYSTVKYNARLYSGTSSDTLRQTIIDNINSFFAKESNKFGKTLYFSKLQSTIDNTDSSVILSSLSNLVLSKYRNILSGVSGTYSYAFNNSIEPGSLTSNEITIKGTNFKLIDLPDTTNGVPYTTGKIGVYRIENDQKIFYSNDVGTINYNTGEVDISNFKIDSSSATIDTPENILAVSVGQGNLVDTSLPNKVYTDYNIYTNGKDQIIVLKENNVFVTMIPDETV